MNIFIKKSEEGGYINNQQEHWDFKFDGVLHNSTQEFVYEECASQIVNGLFDGYNGIPTHAEWHFISQEPLWRMVKPVRER